MEQLRYQVVLCDAARTARNPTLRTAIEKQIADLDLDPNAVLQFLNPYDPVDERLPRVAVYFGGKNYDQSYDPLVEYLVGSSTPVIPALSSLQDFADQVPEKLRPINGFQIGVDLAPLASRVLELFRLIRGRRRVFISYRRKESSNAALQLYQKLDARSFDAFLDTHSVEPAVDFQAELWHRMTDSDLIILLYTPELFQSKWVHEEMTRADAMGLTVIQLIWPNVDRDRRTDLFYPVYLNTSVDLEDRRASEGGLYFMEDRLDSLISLVEGMRARALRSREIKLVDKICGLARETGFIPAVQPGDGYIDLSKDNKHTRICYTLGVPDSTNFESIIGKKEKCFLYDSAYIREDWRKHLEWLGKQLSSQLTTVPMDRAMKFLTEARSK